MKILVTGGAGYIGSHAVYELINQDYEVVIIDSLWRGYKKNLHPQAKFYQLDLRNITKLDNVFKIEQSFDGIMHFAGSIVVNESIQKPLDYYSNNVTSLETLLRVAHKYHVKNIVFSSTAAVYSHTVQCPINEAAATKPLTPYGESKLMAETLLKSWTKATNAHYMIFRYFNVAGAHQNKKIGIRGQNLTHLLPSILEVALKKRAVFEIYGNDYNTKDGTCIRDFIHVIDLVQAHITGLKWIIKNKKSQIINLGSGSGYSVLEVLKNTQKILGIKINSKFKERRLGDLQEVFADISKATQILHWSTKIDLEHIIKSDYEFRKNIKKNI